MPHNQVGAWFWYILSIHPVHKSGRKNQSIIIIIIYPVLRLGMLFDDIRGFSSSARFPFFFQFVNGGLFRFFLNGTLLFRSVYSDNDRRKILVFQWRFRWRQCGFPMTHGFQPIFYRNSFIKNKLAVSNFLKLVYWKTRAITSMLE